MAPTNIDGSQVSGITIDGSAVQEVTVDGTVVFTSSGVTVLEDFNDQDLSDWTGATADWNFSTSTVKEGTASTYQVNSSSGSDAIRDESASVAQGDVIRWYARIASNSVPDGNVFCGYGVQSGGSASDFYSSTDVYAAVLSYESSEIELRRYDSGSPSGTAFASQSVTPPTDEWLTVTVAWNGDNTHEMWVHDSSGSQVANTSGSDSTWTSGGLALASDDDSEGVNQYVDEIVEGVDEPGGANTWVDNFDDQDLSEYSGQTGSYSFDTSTPYAGAASLQRTSTSGGYEQMASTSGLDNYISKGSTFQAKVRSQVNAGSADTSQMAIGWGAADTGNYYQARWEADDDQFFLVRRESSVYNNLDTAGTVTGGSYTAGDWLTIEVTWDDGTLGGSDNDMTAKLMSDDKNTTHVTLTANDSTFASNTGVAIDSYLGTAGAETSVDSYEIL